MSRSRLFAAALVILCFYSLTAAWGAEQSAPASPQNIILISCDGLDRSVVKELLEADKLPNIEALIMEGVFQEIEVVGHITLTKPCHAEMLTGLSAECTGVISNDVFRPIPEGYTIFERLEKQFGKDNIQTIFVSSKIANLGGRGPAETNAYLEQQWKQRRAKALEKANAAGRPTPEAGVVMPNFKSEGEPYYITRTNIDVFDSAQRAVAETGAQAIAQISKHREPRFFAFVHFAEPDSAGHKSGIDCPDFRTGAEECDHWIGEIRNWLREQKLDDKTLIYVMADHGFDAHGTTHNNAPHSWLATNDKSVTRGGIIADVSATILDRFGVDTKSLEPKLIGVPLSEPMPTGRVTPKDSPATEKTQPAKVAVKN